MFQSYELIKYLGYDTATKEHRCKYKITDSDFEEVGVTVEGVGVGNLNVAATQSYCLEVGVVVSLAVIEAYEKRNLNVAANLVLAILYISKRHGYSVQNIINSNKQYNPKFAQYEKDIEKYMVLL